MYEHVSHQGIYEFLDEMANLRFIGLNGVVKPYTREFIASQLSELTGFTDSLTLRQADMLWFYYQSFVDNPPLQKPSFRLRNADFAYNDQRFNMRIRPVLGANFLGNLSGDPALLRYMRHNGADAWASVDNRWGFYASLRDHYASENLVTPAYLTDEPGGRYKPGKNNSVEYSEMRGGVTYGNGMMTFGLVKDHIEWGNHYHGPNIFSSHAPSFVQLKFNLKPVRWFEFNYLHGWLNSGVIDSSRTYSYTNAYGTNTRYVYREKYLAANMFTFIPWTGTNISFGNSIVYADIGLHPAYLTPLSFFKSIDHTLNSTTNAAGQNSQMFLDLSTRFIPHTHLFATLFIDEFASTVMFDPEEHSNCISLKSGFRISNFPIPDMQLTAEYTRSNPLAYQHFVPTTTFESNGFNLGHYLRDNAEESYLALSWEPFCRFRTSASFSYARKGPDYNSLGGRRRGLAFISEERWHRSEFSLSADYQILYNAYFRIAYRYRRSGGPDAPLYEPLLLDGEKHLMQFGLNLGL